MRWRRPQRRLERNRRQKLVQWLLLWEFAGGEPAGQVQCAELDGKPPNAECQLCGSPSGLAVPSVIDTEIYRSAGHRMLKRYSPVMPNGRSQARLSGRSPRPFPNKMPGLIRACIQLRRIVTAANCPPARKFLASLS